MIDKKKLRKIVIILLSIGLIIAIILLGRKALSRYQSDANSKADVDVAFFLVKDSLQENELVLDDIEPGIEKNYNISVSNNNGTIRTETSIQYNLIVETTTNMPLEFELYKVEKIEGDEEIYSEIKCEKTIDVVANADNTYLKDIIFSDTNSEVPFEFGCNENEKTDFILKIILPETLSNDMENGQFSDLIDYIKVKVDAKQKI